MQTMPLVGAGKSSSQSLVHSIHDSFVIKVLVGAIPVTGIQAMVCGIRLNYDLLTVEHVILSIVYENVLESWWEVTSEDIHRRMIMLVALHLRWH